MNELWIAGYPGLLGGAKTETLHIAGCLSSHGVQLHFVPYEAPEDPLRRYCDSKGWPTHGNADDVFAGKTVAAWNEGRFLLNLPSYMKHGPPAKVIFFNCMTFTNQWEIACHKQGWIDLYGFVSNHQKALLTHALSPHGPVNEFSGYIPHLNPDNDLQPFRFKPAPLNDEFVIVRVSRDDPTKYSGDTFQMYDKIDTGRRTKRVVLLGYGPKCRAAFGDPPGDFYEIYDQGSVPVQSVYERAHCLVYAPGGSGESFGRFVLECWASGVPVITTDSHAFPELIEDCITGLLCRDALEMSCMASVLACDEKMRRRLIQGGYDKLRTRWADSDKCFEPWKAVL